MWAAIPVNIPTCDIHPIRTLAPHCALIISPRACFPYIMIALPSWNPNNSNQFARKCAANASMRWKQTLSLKYSLPEQGLVSSSCSGQLSWFWVDWIINVLDRDWRPVVSKLLPSIHVNSQELHSDHSAKWQSPSCKKKGRKINYDCASE